MHLMMKKCLRSLWASFVKPKSGPTWRGKSISVLLQILLNGCPTLKSCRAQLQTKSMIEVAFSPRERPSFHPRCIVSFSCLLYRSRDEAEQSCARSLTTRCKNRQEMEGKHYWGA